MRITLCLLLFGILALIWTTSEAADFGEIEVVPNTFNPQLPTHHDLILDIDNLSSDVITSGTISGLTVRTNDLIVGKPESPTQPTDSCETGTVAWDSSYIFICVSPNTWERVAIASWSAVDEFLLLEIGDFVLLEIGDKIILE